MPLDLIRKNTYTIVRSPKGLMMNQRSIQLRLKRQRRWCVAAIVGICVFSYLSISEVLSPQNPIVRVTHFTARQNIKGVSVVATETATQELPVDSFSMPSPVSVPEPASLLLLAPALVLLTGRRRGK
jgi:hypothetical protein